MTAPTSRVTPLLLLTLAACAGHVAPAVDAKYAPPPEPVGAPTNALTPSEVAEGWVLLFNGRTTSGWHAWRSDSAAAGWQVLDGALTHSTGAEDLVTAGKFRDFDLKFDWRTARAAVGGLFYRADDRSTAIVESAPEFEVLGDSLQFAEESPYSGAAGVTGLYATRKGVLEPTGNWNHAELIVQGRRVEHRLNGVRVLQYVLESSNWVERVRQSAFAHFPQYGRGLEGHIAFAGSGNGVEYANVKIRVVP